MKTATFLILAVVGWVAGDTESKQLEPNPIVRLFKALDRNLDGVLDRDEQTRIHAFDEWLQSRRTASQRTCFNQTKNYAANDVPASFSGGRVQTACGGLSQPMNPVRFEALFRKFSRQARPRHTGRDVAKSSSERPDGESVVASFRLLETKILPSRQPHDISVRVLENDAGSSEKHRSAQLRAKKNPDLRFRRKAGGPNFKTDDGSKDVFVRKTLPERYAKYDADNDGQVGLYEWNLDDAASFAKHDRNKDGFLTADELQKRPRRHRSKKQGKN